MGTILLFFLLIIVAVLFLGVGFISRFISLFTKGPDAAGRRYSNNRNRNSSDNQSQSSTGNTKVFGKEEGEYVDFEEIK